MSDRRPIVAGNWKMNKTADESEVLAKDVVAAVGGIHNVDVVICPTFVGLDRVSKAVSGSNVKVGGQNVHWEPEGAYTGEISTAILLTSGCSHVILGHSERRQFFGDSDETVNRRLRAALGANLTPIVCVGELQGERESGDTARVVSAQVQGALQGFEASDIAKLVMAYEPVWAIGTGLTATPGQAEEVHALIRGELAGLADSETADRVRIQYGGSVKPDNAAELFSKPNIDGGLIGGAALDADSFAAIVKAAQS
jgi:triosephosphate isomerase